MQTMVMFALHTAIDCMIAYLNILQLGLHSRVVFCCLDGFAFHIIQEATYILQFSLKKGTTIQSLTRTQSPT